MVKEALLLPSLGMMNMFPWLTKLLMLDGRSKVHSSILAPLKVSKSNLINRTFCEPYRSITLEIVTY